MEKTTEEPVLAGFGCYLKWWVDPNRNIKRVSIDASLVRFTSFALLEPWGCVEVVRGVVRGVVREQNAWGLS